MSRTNRKSTKNYKAVIRIITALLGIVIMIFSVMLIRFSLLPWKIRILALLLVWIVGIGIGVLGWKKRKAFWPAVVLSVLIMLVLDTGIYYLYHTEKMMDKVMNTVVQVDAISAYVLKDNAAQDIGNTKGYKFGILKEVDRENTDKAIAEMEENLDFSLDCIEYEDMLSMVDALYEEEADVIILNDAYVPVIAEVFGYETFAADIRALTTSVQEEEVVVEKPKMREPEFFLTYISGIDTYGGVTNKSRSDVNILMAVNTKTKQVLLLSTPRDYYVELPIAGGNMDKLTHAGLYGVDTSVGALENVYDVDVDYFVRMNFSGFIDIIDALGGVDVYSAHNFTVDPIMTYQKGYNHVNGLQALAFARERKSFASGDFQRGQNQMEIIKAVMKKCTSPAILANYAELMASVSDTFETSVPEQRIAELVNAQLFDGDSWNVVSYGVTGTCNKAETYSIPGLRTDVVLPDEASVAYGRELLECVRNGGILTQEDIDNR